MWKRACNIFAAICLFFPAALGQKLPFQSFNTDKGLIQTQVSSITQDQQRHLWLGTTGGIDRFDGTTFTHFTKKEGLNTPAINCIYTAPNGYIWAGTLKGVSCHNGQRIVNYPLHDAVGSIAISSISSDEKNNIWLRSTDGFLFRLTKDSFVKVTRPVKKMATCFYKDSKGYLFVGFKQNAIYKWANDQWKKIPDIPLDSTVKVNTLLQTDNTWYAITDSTILMYSNGLLRDTARIPEGKFSSACFDKKGDIWVGTDKGLWVFNAKTLNPIIKYSSTSGLSDNNISSLYVDIEGNLWIGTDGDGLFKFSDGSFSRYDKSNGLQGNVVMGIANTTEGNLYLATREGGLVQYNMADKTMTPMDVSLLGKGGFNCIATNKNDHLFLGKLNGGLFEYYKGKWKQISLIKGSTQPIPNSIAFQDDKVWIAAGGDGCFYLKNGIATKIDGINSVAVTVLPLANGEVLIGTYQEGLFLYTGNGPAQKVSIPQLQDIPVLSMASKGPWILIGTFDDGLYYWNRLTNKIYNCNTSNDLAYNQVYNILIDSKQRTWIGSGTSIQQIIFDENNGHFSVTSYSAADGFENGENNLNAIIEDKYGRIWIGTTQGAFIYTKGEPVVYNKGPYVVIQQVNVSDSSVLDSAKLPWYPLPANLVLPYSKNNISFTVKGIFMKHPEAVRYACQLVGYDKDFSPIADQNFFNYQNLEPGEYTFRVKAYTASGLQSDNIAEYSFTVATPFYKTTWFLLLVILALLLTGGVTQFLFMRATQRKQRQHTRMRKEEQQAIRLRTSEDFHDELGNKLTRISLLTDILQKKTGTEDAEKNKLIAQIKENVLALYGGTRDIIWSLSSGSDNLLETLKRIEQFGEELFQSSGINFELSDADKVDPTTVLPMDYSRNILMIFKESLNNSLKHAQCTRVTIVVEALGNSAVRITQTDNGLGFDEATVQKGNGLNNIRRRAQRINAELTVTASANNGVSIALLLKIPPKG